MRGIEHLHPKAEIKAKELQALCDSKGLKLLITETFRTTAEQDALYAQGRTKPGKIVTNCKGSSFQSPHQWGVAFDFCKNVRGQEYSDTAFFKLVGALAKSIGLFWGGDFKSFVDMPHIELPEFLPSNSTKTLITNYGTPDKFKAVWGSDSDTTLKKTMPTLRLGARGGDVATLQGLLNGILLCNLKVDGIFGAKTDEALRTYQQMKGLVVDGIAGKNTWTALGQ